MSLEVKEIYEFGQFRLDVGEHSFSREDGVRNGSLPEKAFQTLTVLVRNQGRLLTKQELLDEVWPDTFVEENNLDKCIHAIRHAVGEKPGEHRYIETVRKRGYRFVADVQRINKNDEPLRPDAARHVRADDTLPSPLAENLSQHVGNDRRSKRISNDALYRRLAFVLAGLILISALVLLINLVRPLTGSSDTSNPAQIQSLAILPLKSLNREASDNYLGLGIADTIIKKLSRIGGLTVRPTSAVRKYADQDIDSIEAGKQLQAEAVLDGTFMHAGDRLRVSVNLLRVKDGTSLWADSFDMNFTDIFAIQDEVSKEVAERLSVRLGPVQQAQLSKRYTTSPEAYSYYTKAMYHFEKRDFADVQHETEIAIDLFKKAIEIDPKYALAHAHLGYAYAWIADFKDGGPGLIAMAKEELGEAERLDPQLAEVHIARSFIAWSHYEDWQIEAAIREGRLAKQLNPNSGDQLQAALYYHVGLEEQATREYELALERDPTSDTVKVSYRYMYSNLARPDEWLALNQRLFNRGPDGRYYLEKGMLKEAEPLIEEEYLKTPDEPRLRRDRALLRALQGKHREAQAAVPGILEKVRRYKGYHHYPYDIARIYALDGKSKEALKWLRITVKEGFPCYTLFARDPLLDRIRKDPAFIEFITEMKIRWEGYRREFEE